MIFRIGHEELVKRRKNNWLGLLFSIGMMVLLAAANAHNQERYNDFLFGSVVLFLVLANMINLVRHVQWSRTIAHHHIEAGESGLTFVKGEEKTHLPGDQINSMRTKEKNGATTVVFMELANGNRIRLEGYTDMNGLAAAIRQVIPAKAAKDEAPA